ncbi:hypothetical protein ACWGJ2_02185 [Streptomyces sp. NPDC054796]
MAPKVLTFAAGAGIAAGLFLAADSAAVDLPGNEHPLPNTLGVFVPLLGVLLITGLYVVARAEAAGAGRLLDWGFLLNLCGLVLVCGIDVTRAYALSQLSDRQVEQLLESGPTLPVFLAAGLVFTVGALLFGTALIRAGYGGGAWLYTLTAVPSGFASLLPDVAGALAQVVAGAGIVWLALTLRARIRTAPAPPPVPPAAGPLREAALPS